MADTRTDSAEAGLNSSGATDPKLELLCSLFLNDLTATNYNQTLQAAICSTAEHIHAEHGYVLFGVNGGQLETVACYPGTDDKLPATFSEAVAANVLKTGQIQYVQNAMANQEFFGDPSFQRFNIRTAICVPIKVNQAIAGVIYFDTVRSQPDWDGENLKLLGLVANHIGMAVEITRLQQEKEKNCRLIEAGQAVVGISHSVKNILQLIGGAVEVIDFGLRTNEIHRVKRSWDILKPNLERIRKFMLDLLDFSKERHFEPGPCELNKIVQNTIDSLRAQLKEKSTQLQLRIDQNIPVIELDADGFHVLVTNLIFNGIDAANEQKGIVGVETKYLAGEESVQIIVSDNGEGLTEETRKNIFQPFRPTKNKMRSGLGLAIAKRITEQHRGRIEVESKPGKGTTFRVILPAKVLPGN